jgi:Hemerythrin HHE cation binding domain
MADAKVTTDHQKIKTWVEERGGRPAAVKGTGSGNDPGVLRIDFPGYTGDESLRVITWEEFFNKFEKERLAFLYQEETSEGGESRFSKLINKEHTDAKTNTEGETMSPFELLKQDHKKVAGILEQLGQTTEKAIKTRDELFAKLYSELDAHTRMEEEIFYPVLKDAEETREITNEAVEEHRVVKILLKELEVAKKGSEQWTAKFTVLKENIEHHVEEEEGEMFKKARKALSKEQIDELGRRMAAAKKRLAAAKTA